MIVIRFAIQGLESPDWYMTPVDLGDMEEYGEKRSVKYHLRRLETNH